MRTDNKFCKTLGLLDLKTTGLSKSTLQHPKGDPEAQRQSARMFQNSLFSLLPRGPMGCPLAVRVWDKAQAPIARSLVAWWQGRRQHLSPHSTQLAMYNHRLLQLGGLRPSLLVLRMLMAVMSVATLPCPVPVAVLLDNGQMLMGRGTSSCVGSCSICPF